MITSFVSLVLLYFTLICKGKFSVGELNGAPKVRGVNLGGWLVVEGWIKPSLFDGIPNGDMLDGTKVQFKSVMLQKYMSAENGGGSNITVDRDNASSWETFKLWRISEEIFRFRTLGGDFLTLDNGLIIAATAESSTMAGKFLIKRHQNKVHMKLLTAQIYLQARSVYQLTADYQGVPDWGDNAATFEMIIVANDLHGDYQLANGYEPDKARSVLQQHRDSFVTQEDFRFLSQHDINAVRIPVGWWIAQDPNPPAPFVGGTLAVLDNAFSWAQVFGLKCIIDLHAAPGSQNGMEHSASRDGSSDWATNPSYISQSLEVIDFLSSRYANHPAMLGIELLNEPSASSVPLNVLVSYYSKGYQIVRNYSSVYVIICERIGNADPLELYQVNIGLANVVVDLHFYNLFDNFFTNMSAEDNIRYIYQQRQNQLQALNRANGPLVFVGEWVNEWNVADSSKEQYQTYGYAQLQIYNAASFGWAYWTLKNARMHWDFEWNIRNNYLEFGSCSRRHIGVVPFLVASLCLWLLFHQGL